jgi:hypothetical protein
MFVQTSLKFRLCRIVGPTLSFAAGTAASNTIEQSLSFSAMRKEFGCT